MAPDAFRALFLEAGVETVQARTALQDLTREANKAEHALIGVARATSRISTGAAVRGNEALARSYRGVGKAARDTQLDLFHLEREAFRVQRNVQLAGFSTSAPMNRGALMNPRLPFLMAASAGMGPYGVYSGGSSNFRTFSNSYASRMATPWSPGAFMGGIQVPGAQGGRAARLAARTGGVGNYGLGTSLYLTTLGLGVGGYAYGQSANLQRASTLAAFASGQTPAQMRAQSLALRGEFGMRLRASTALTQEIAQLGHLTPEGQRELSRAGAGFSVLEPNIEAGDAAGAIYRLIKATTRSEEEFNAGTAAATRYAGAIYAAGNTSAAGAASVFAMVQEIEPLAQFMRLGANGTIALSAAFADLNENQRELFRGALTRMAAEGKIDPNNPIQSLLSIAQRLREAGSEAEKINLLKSMGFDNIRDVQTLAVMAASLDTFGRALEVVNEELVGTSQFGSRIKTVLADQQGAWDALKSSMDGMAASVMTAVAPALMTLMGLLTGLADTVAANPMLAAVLGLGAGVWAVKSAGRLWQHHFGSGLSSTERMANLGMTTARRDRLANSMMFLPGFSRGGGRLAKRFAETRLGMSLAEGLGLAGGKGLGRMNGLTLGLMRLMPGGDRMAVGAASRMAAGGIAGTALRVATGPVGWIITALTIGAPLFERIATAFGNIAQQGGAVGVVFNTLGLIFEVIAAGGRILNEAFDWIGKSGKFLLDMVTFGHGEELLAGTNKGLEGARNWVAGVGRDDTKPGAQSQPPRAPGGTVVNINTGGSQSGYQLAMDEVGRRSVRSVQSNTYGGIPV